MSTPTSPRAHVTLPANPAAAWVYRGVWGVLSSLFLVPHEPPTLPAAPGESLDTFKPSPKFLQYLKIGWYIRTGCLALAWLVLSSVIVAASPLAAIFVSPLLLAVFAVPTLISLVALHLRFDTTWYVLSPRSMRIRRGAWIVQETSITYENIQQVAVMQGPVQRFLGIATVMVTTAGGGGGGNPAHGGGMSTHLGLIEGIEDPDQIREMVLARQRASRSAGLGDERFGHHSPDADPSNDAGHATSRGPFTPEHVAALREIRNALALT